MKKFSFLLTMTLFLWVNSVVQARTVVTEADDECKQWVESLFATFTQQDKVGQLVVAALPADLSQRGLVRELIREYKVGGLLFTRGTAEAQVALTNQANKETVTPLLITFDGRRSHSLPLDGMPLFPNHQALTCIQNQTLLEAYRQEMAREFAELGVQPTIETELKANGMILAEFDLKGVIAQLQADVASGKITQAELDERCRKALAYKYTHGVRGNQAAIPVKGVSMRIHTEAARTLAAQLRLAAVTVMSNHFNILPLTPVEGGIALLNIGDKGMDNPFAETLQKHAAITRFYLSWQDDDATRQAIAKQLESYRRVIICITGTSYIGGRNADFLKNLKLPAAVVYTFFTSHYPLLSVSPVLANASAVVLAHGEEADLQRYVADVLFAQTKADGKLGVSIGSAFPIGSGCTIEPGMKPGELIPEDYGMRSSALRGIDILAEKGIREGAYPGCRVLVWKDGRTVYDKGFGTHSTIDQTPVRSTDLFDLSTMTKSTATLLAVMKLYDEGKLKLTDRISQYIPALRTVADKKDITLRDLLLHESGLPPYIRFYMELIDPRSVHGPYSQSWEDEWHHTQVSEHGFYSSDFKFKSGMVSSAQTATHTLQMADGLWVNKNFRNNIMQAIAKAEMAPSKRSVYSDLGFILLQEVIENITHTPLNTYLDKTFYTPMGLTRTLFQPLNKYPKAEIMPTATNDYLRRQDICGYVHDETAACLGGIAGNAGLFSTAEEVAKIYQMLLNGGELDGQRYFSEATCSLFLTEKSTLSRRGLGFDKPDTKNARRTPCAVSASAEVFGHVGSAGTCVWADPTNNTIFVFLSNRLYPHAWSTKLNDLEIEQAIHEVVYQSLK